MGLRGFLIREKLCEIMSNGGTVITVIQLLHTSFTNTVNDPGVFALHFFQGLCTVDCMAYFLTNCDCYKPDKNVCHYM